MATSSMKRSPFLPSLRKRWALYTLLCLSVLAGGYLLLHTAWGSSFALRWVVLSSLAMLYPIWVLWRGLESNYRLGESQLLPTLGAGNNLTLLRGVLVASLAGFLFSPWPQGWLAWIPAVLYMLADAADFFDGYLARVKNHATRLGKLLDMSIDGVGVLVATLLAIQYGQLPLWYLVVALARYLFLGGERLRRRLGKPVYPLPPAISRRAFAGVQMGFLAAALWPVFSPPGTHIAAVFFALPFLVGFGRDWLIASGVLRPAEISSGRLGEVLTRWLPVGLRLAIVGLSLGYISQRFLDYQHQVAFYTLQGMPAARSGVLFLGLLEGLVLSMLLLGAAGRVVSILGLCLIGINQMYSGLSAAQALLVVAYTGILFLGTGALSLWKPENYLIYHQAGENRMVANPSRAGK